MNDNLVKVGYDYLKVIEEIIDGKDIYRLFHVLNAIKLKENYNLGLKPNKSVIFDNLLTSKYVLSQQNGEVTN